MHKRRRKKYRAAGLCLFAVLCAAAALAVLWMRWQTKPHGSALAWDGPLRAVYVSPGESGLAAMDEDALDAEWDSLLALTRSLGLSAVAIDADPVSGAVLFRSKEYPVTDAVAGSDSFLHKYDPLAALCEKAGRSGVAVCAVTDALSAGALDALRDYPVTVLAQSETPAAADLSAPWALYAASCSADFNGALIDYADAKADPQAAAAAATILTDAGQRAPLLADVPQTLAVAYPFAGEKIWASSCYVMGPAAPGEPVLVNGQEAAARGENGVYGALVALEEGENVITVEQGGQTASVTVTRPVPAAGGSSGGETEIPHDMTVEVEPGIAVRTTGWITSLLYDPSGDGYINETVRQGAVTTVVSCAETLRSGYKTWAYQLASGDFVLASNVEVLDAVPGASFTGAVATATDSGETLVFEGAGTPLAYTSTRGSSLSVRLYTAGIAPDFAVAGSSMVKNVTVSPLDGGVELLFEFDAPLWGHSVEYENGTLKLTLTRTPTLSGDLLTPLAGVRVLLDPGHGGQDIGAMGAAGASAPCEKDVNLAVALAAKERLEQLGATVWMTREDDSFPSLVDRNRMIAETQPDFFISVHHNSLALTQDTSSASGAEAYYFYDASAALAQSLVNNVTTATGRPALGAKWGYYYVARSTVCPAVLLETGFMVNPAEYGEVTDEATVRAAGAAIAQSVYDAVAANGA